MLPQCAVVTVVMVALLAGVPAAFSASRIGPWSVAAQGRTGLTVNRSGKRLFTFYTRISGPGGARARMRDIPVVDDDGRRRFTGGVAFGRSYREFNPAIA